LVAKVFDAIDPQLREWIAKQHMFFVASAPLSGDGHVNLSPKGPIGTLRVLDEHTVAYLDLIGSGAETIAHLRENGRIVVMLCSFDGPPRILRLHGRGQVVTADDPRFGELIERCDFEQPAVTEARRAIVVVDVTRIGDSCGYGVPLMEYQGRRPQMEQWATKRLRTGGPDALRAYQREKNAESLDGLPAVQLDGGEASAVEAEPEPVEQP
jgi:predicted pyridoxine 5'-phosphate oxidase superfamily flavin-nucleotide-binding protein